MKIDLTGLEKIVTDAVVVYHLRHPGRYPRRSTPAEILRAMQKKREDRRRHEIAQYHQQYEKYKNEN